MPLYIAPDGTKTLANDIKIQAGELSQHDGTSVSVVNINRGDHNLVLMADEVRSLVSALQSMANEVNKANRAREA